MEQSLKNKNYSPSQSLENKIQYDSFYNSLPWLKANVEAEKEVLPLVIYLYRQYFDENTGPNIISNELIEDLNNTMFLHKYVASKHFNEENFCILEVLNTITFPFNEEEKDFVIDVINSIMLAYGGSRLQEHYDNIALYEDKKLISWADGLMKKLDFTNRIMGKWCLNEEIDILLMDAKDTCEKLEKEVNKLLEQNI